MDPLARKLTQQAEQDCELEDVREALALFYADDIFIARESDPNDV